MRLTLHYHQCLFYRCFDYHSLIDHWSFGCWTLPTTFYPKVWPAILLSPNSFDSKEPVPEAKDLEKEKRTISYLSVLARIGVIDPFSQMKREYNTILDDADSANRNNCFPSQSFTWCSPGNFSQGHQYVKPKEDKGDREGIHHTHPIP